MKLIMSLTGIVLLYLIYGFYLSQVDLDVLPRGLEKNHPKGFYDYRGVTNVRTELSNGSSHPMEVVQEGKAAGLDFLILTDINPYESMEALNGYHGNLLVMNEGEYPFLDSRLLYYSSTTQKNAPVDSSETSMFFTDLLSKGPSETKNTLLVLAHPFQNGQSTWTGSYPSGIDGIEILNPKAISQEAWRKSKANVIWSFIVYPFSVRYSFIRLFSEPTEEVALWDRLAEKQKVLGFAGAEASARAIPFANTLLKFPSYQTSFGITSNHILVNSELTGSYQKDRQKVFSALKQGHFYISLDLLGDPTGFLAVIEDRDRRYLMGETIKFKSGLNLTATLPGKPDSFFEIVVFKDGERAKTSNEQSLQYEIPGPGVYRVIVRIAPTLPIPDAKKWITWIYTNHFTIQ